MSQRTDLSELFGELRHTQCECAPAECSVGYSAYVVPQAAKFPMVIRMPDHPGTFSTCPCKEGTVYALGLQMYAAGKLHATIKPPYRVYMTTDKIVEPCAHGIGAQCAALDKGSVYIYVTTDDPNAPARNLIIQETSSYWPCP